MSPLKCYILAFAFWAGTRAAPAGPLIIDPTVTIDNGDDAIRDTRLQNATKWGRDATLMVGKKSDSVKKRSLLKFDFAYSGIPSNATVLNALLQLYYYDAQRAGSDAWQDRWVQAHQVLNNWDELQADSLKRLTGVNWLAPRGKIGPGSNPASEDANGQFESTMLFQSGQTNTWKVWNLTALTQKWLNGTAANHGVILWATNEDVNAYDLRFYSRENATNQPKLVVTWSNTPKTVYFLKDHLGSTRATVDQTGTVVCYDDYDPWGYSLGGRMMATQWSASQSVAENKFTGKERDDDFGINWDYFGARYYDAQIGRWMARDPLGQKHPEASPYSYVLNNPLILVDPDGRQVFYSSLFKAPPTSAEIKQNLRQSYEESRAFASAGLFQLAAGRLTLGLLEAASGTLENIDPGGISGLANPIMMTGSLAKSGASLVDDAAASAARISAEGVSKETKILSGLGRASKNEGIREVVGSADDAQKLFDQLRGNNPVKEVKPGVFIAESTTKPGTYVTFRASSKSGPPTIDVHGIEKGIRKIKFVEE